MKSRRRRKYIPDLQNQGAVCEANFVKLQKLLSGRDAQDHWHYHLHDGRHGLGAVSFQVLDRSRYTLTLEVRYQSGSLLVTNNPRILNVRLYEDACLAEVVRCHQGRQLKGVYPYPNDNMYQVDEKSQINQFLSECLTHCLKFGLVSQYPFPLSSAS